MEEFEKQYEKIKNLVKKNLKPNENEEEVLKALNVLYFQSGNKEERIAIITIREEIEQRVIANRFKTLEQELERACEEEHTLGV